MVPNVAKKIESLVRRVDDFQQRHAATAFVFGVTRKFGDDRGGALAALITYYSFIALFPSLLVLYTILGFVLPHYPAAEQNLTESVLRQFPVIGPQLQGSITQNVHPLHGSVMALVVGLFGACWGTLGATQVAQYAMNDIWDVPNKDRPGFFPRLGRSVVLSLVLLIGIIGGSIVAGLGTALGLGAVARLATIGLSFVLTLTAMVAAFRLLTAGDVSTRQLFPGALGAAVGLQLLQTIGVALLRHQLRHASNVYGTFGLILGLLAWLYLFSELLVYSAEVDAVFVKRLWPRSILQPPLTRADKRALVDIARREVRREDQDVEVHFAASTDESNPSV